MKFLILTQFFPPETGAAQTRLWELSHQLHSQGHEVEVLTALPNYPLGSIFPEYKNKFYVKDYVQGITIHRFWLYTSQGKSWLRLLSYLSFMVTSSFGVFLCKKPDYIFINSGPLFLAIPGRLLSLVWQRPVIFNVADLWPRSVEKLDATGAKYLLKLALYLEKWAYKKSKLITAVTEGIHHSLLTEKNIVKERLLFMPNGVNTELYQPQSSEKAIEIRQKLSLQDKFVFIYPGNHGFAHALDNILNAAHLIQKESAAAPDLQKIHILFVGGGSDKSRLLGIADQYKLNNVTFHDPVSQNELVDYLQLADVGLINIRNTHLAQETRPAKMFPIMAMEKPILFAGISEGSDIIRDSKGGVIIEAENPEQMKIAMIEMLRAKYDLKEMGQNNRKYVIQHLQFGQIVKAWLEDLQKKEKSV